MKKFIAILLIAGSLVACNDSSNASENATDSIDAAASDVKDRLDETNASDKAIDSAKDKIDSSAEAKKDSVTNRTDSTTH